ncbi:hypothetical protein QJS10_CPA01g01472 [Acorus calamus]|uniref:Uncharacterized protein n=1 Tax=Acorus calamus TaxID=4465 RepID=A0AAV9FKF5_ACOCL|nr:hypothetical protein QJS10_CPA01g01472 [Acorus calamus]
MSNEDMELRRGPWTLEEDTILIHYIACHGEGRWNHLARCSGLKRTGKSCRLRWLNYLKPDVKRGNLSPEEQILILELHSKWGNRWSRIAQHLPGRTDNEIKNYWRTRVQKHARQLKVDANSPTFRDAIRRFWMPRLLQKMGPNSVLSPTTTTATMTTTMAIPTTTMTESDKKNQISESNCGSSNSSELAQFPEFATDACDGFYDMGFMFYDVNNSAQAVAAPPDHDFFVGGGAAGDGGLWIMDESWEEL